MFAAKLRPTPYHERNPSCSCRTGQPAQQVAAKLEQFGYSNVLVVSDGFEGVRDE